VSLLSILALTRHSIARDPTTSTENKKRSLFDKASGTKEAVKQSADERIPEDVRDDSSGSETRGKGMLGKIRGFRVFLAALIFRQALMHPTLQNGLSDRIPQEHKDRVSDESDRVKKFFSDEYFPPERRDQFIYRGKKVIIECQKHDDYQASLKWLLDTLENYSANGKEVVKNAHTETKGVAQVRILSILVHLQSPIVFVPRIPPSAKPPMS